MTLTSGELQLLELIAQGKSNKEIAAELNMPEQTMKNKLSIVYRKLGVRNRTGAVIWAIKQGLVTIRR